MNFDDFISRLDNVKQQASGYTARCPHHEDRKNSLGISRAESGHILIKCYAGCDFDDIVKTMGLEKSDLMPEASQMSQKEISYKLLLSDGSTVEHVRIDEPGGKKFLWRRDGKSGLDGLKVQNLPLYKPNVNHSKTSSIFITEGEKSAIAAAKLGCKAYGTVCGASSCPSKESLEICRDENVILWADQDDPGMRHMQAIKNRLRNIAKSTVIIQTGDDKDDAADFKGTIGDLKEIVATARAPKHVSQLSTRVDGAMTLMRKYSNNDTSNRIPLGITRLDYMMRGGMMPGALYLLGAPSGHGKTTLLQCIAIHCARTRGPVLFVSPEMSGEELAERETVRQSGVSISDIAPAKHPNIRLPNLVKLEETAERIKNECLPVYVVDDVNISMLKIGDIAKGIKDLRLVIVDYAQEIANRDEAMARYLAVGEVGKDAIQIGKSLNVPVMVASQVNVFKEGSKRDYAFRETKDLEHRAHCSMIMEVTRSETPNKYGYYEVESTRIFARKNRSGAVFSVDVEYNPALFEIKNKNVCDVY